jgi:hypothetical protein
MRFAFGDVPQELKHSYGQGQLHFVTSVVIGNCHNWGRCQRAIGPSILGIENKTAQNTKSKPHPQNRGWSTHFKKKPREPQTTRVEAVWK